MTNTGTCRQVGGKWESFMKCMQEFCLPSQASYQCMLCCVAASRGGTMGRGPFHVPGWGKGNGQIGRQVPAVLWDEALEKYLSMQLL